MAYIKFDVDFISTNDDLAEYAHEMANQARTDFLIFFPSYKHISKALQKCMKSNLAFKAFHSIFLLLLVGFFSHYSLSSIIHSMRFYLGYEFSDFQNFIWRIAKQNQ